MPRDADETQSEDLVLELRQQVAGLQGALREARERLRVFTVCSPVGIFLDDAQGNAIYINDKCAELVGVPAEDALNLDWVPYIHPDDRDAVTAAWFDAVGNGKEFHQEYRWVHPDGKVVWTLGDIVPVRGTDGEVTLFIGTLTDITDRKQAEEERGKLQLQLTHARRLESIGRLAGGVAHDYNNMLAVILGYAELAQSKVAPSAPVQHHLQQIVEAARRSAEVTRQLLAFARKQTISPRVFELNETIGRMHPMLVTLIGERIDIAWLPGRGPHPVRMDPAQLEQLLINLCINARDAIADIGKITIETGRVIFDETYCAEHPGFVPGEFVLLAVSDSGRGMDAPTLAHVFEPFFTTKDPGRGTGLGLATVYGIVKQNDGFVNVYSEPGKGTVFRIYLRVCADRPAVGVEPAAAAPRGHGETVLVVEDEVAVLELTAIMLGELGYRPLAAHTLGEALALAGKHASDIDLLITDVVMPEINGKDLVGRLRESNPELKCLYMSGYTANMIAHHGVLDDNVNFIQKPFSANDLVVSVNRALNSAS